MRKISARATLSTSADCDEEGETVRSVDEVAFEKAAEGELKAEENPEAEHEQSKESINTMMVML